MVCKVSNFFPSSRPQNVELSSQLLMSVSVLLCAYSVQHLICSSNKELALLNPSQRLETGPLPHVLLALWSGKFLYSFFF